MKCLQVPVETDAHGHTGVEQCCKQGKKLTFDFFLLLQCIYSSHVCVQPTVLYEKIISRCSIIV